MRIQVEEFFQKMITVLVVLIINRTKGLISQNFTVLTLMMKLVFRERSLNIVIKKRRDQEFLMNIFVANAMNID